MAGCRGKIVGEKVLEEGFNEVGCVVNLNEKGESKEFTGTRRLLVEGESQYIYMASKHL